MDTFNPIGYAGRHETSWEPQSVGAASPAGHPTAEEGPNHVGCGGAARVFPQFRGALASNLQAGWAQRLGTAVHSGPTAPAISSPQEAIATPARLRTLGSRVFHRSVDAGTDRSANPAASPRAVWDLPGLANPAQPGVELPEAGASGAPAQRKRHRPLETIRLAAYKKRPSAWGLTSRSSTRVGSRSRRPLSGRGPRWVRPLSFIIGLSETSSLSSALWWSPRANGDWRSISIVRSEPSTAWMSELSVVVCCGTSGVRWSWSGTGAPSTSVKRCRCTCSNIREFILTTSRPMRRNSIPLNTSGARRIAHWPMAHRTTWPNYAADSSSPSEDCAVHNGCFGPASMLPSSPGTADDVHSL